MFFAIPRSLFALIVLFVLSGFFSQVEAKECFKLMCYNVENLFDCVDDTLTNDAEYLFGGVRGWSSVKYEKKLAGIAKVIVSYGEWEAPAVVGLCEVESEKCLRDLTLYSGLKSQKYKYVHYDSPDTRGVDVALLYQSKLFKVLQSTAIAIEFPFSPQSKTRDILYVKGNTVSNDTLHLFVCHFPSRLGGELESEEKRLYVASVLKAKVDSLLKVDMTSKIIAMGDFNDYPTNKSIAGVLKAVSVSEAGLEDGKLYNLMSDLHQRGLGTHKFEGEWGALDQFIVSSQLLLDTCKLHTSSIDCFVLKKDFLLEEDKAFLGVKPFRTYVGMQYQGGFSDHLPICLNLWY